MTIEIGAPLPPLKILRMKDLVEYIGLSKSKVYEMVSTASPKYDPSFPKQVPLGPGSVGWLAGEVDAWIGLRAASRNA